MRNEKQFCIIKRCSLPQYLCESREVCLVSALSSRDIHASIAIPSSPAKTHQAICPSASIDCESHTFADLFPCACSVHVLLPSSAASVAMAEEMPITALVEPLAAMLSAFASGVDSSSRGHDEENAFVVAMVAPMYSAINARGAGGECKEFQGNEVPNSGNISAMESFKDMCLRSNSSVILQFRARRPL